MKIKDLNDKHQKVMKFAKWTMDKIGIKNRPTIELTDDISIVKKHRAYGATTPDGKIWVYVGNRTPADSMRTLCHEILHAKQFEDGVASDNMDNETEQYIEDEANAIAGRLMRKYGKKDGSIYESISPEVMKIGFSSSKQDDDLTLRATTIDGKPLFYRGPVLKIEAMIDGKKVGEALFQEKKQHLFAQDVRVSPAYSGMGIAGAMYRFVRELGATIRPSTDQSEEGSEMWDRFYKSGTAQKIMNEEWDVDADKIVKDAIKDLGIKTNLRESITPVAPVHTNNNTRTRYPEIPRKDDPRPGSDTGFNKKGNKDNKSDGQPSFAEVFKNINKVKESLRDGEHHVWVVHFDDGTKKRISVTSDEVTLDMIKNHYAKQGKNVVKVDKDYAVQTVEHEISKIVSTPKFELGDLVYSKSLTAIGKIVEINGENVRIRIGNRIYEVKLGDLLKGSKK